MTDFPVDSTKSAFQRLSTVRIRGDDDKPTPKPAPAAKEENSDAAPVRIFNEVANRSGDPKRVQAAVGGLEKAVTNLDETKETIDRISTADSPEIEAENRLAAQAARITDLKKASDLADELRDRIVKNQGVAKNAFSLNAQTVEQLLR